MPYDLAAMAQRKGIRRAQVKLRPIKPRPGIAADLAAIYAVLPQMWWEAIDRIMAQYAPVKPITDSPEDLARTIELVYLETMAAGAKIMSRLRVWSRKAEKIFREQWREGVLAATSIDVGTMLGEAAVAEPIEAVVARNANLITAISADTKAKVSDIVFRGVQARTPTREVERQLREQVGFSKDRAWRVAGDQTTKLYSALDQARQEEAGIDHFVWVHSRKAHPRPEHVVRNQILYKWRKTAPDPGRDPPGDMPGYLPFCGCTAQAVLLGMDGKPL